MPLSDTYHRLPLESITVLRDERQRRELDTSDLEKSIARLGVISPIIVKVERIGPDEADDVINVLVAGERRLQACKNLGLPDIPARFAHELSPTESQIIELEENIKRQDLSWPDLVRAIRRIHALYLDLDPEWTQAETARQCSLTDGTISMYLKISEIPRDDSRVWSCGTVREAYNVLGRREEREMGNALEELLGPRPQPTVAYLKHPDGSIPRPAEPNIAESILHESFLEWAPRWDGPRFNLIHCDFPYGINFSSGQQGLGSEDKTYKDDPNLYWDLLDCLCTHWRRIASHSCHLVFWFSDKHRDATLQTFRDRCPWISFHEYPLIWLKSDNAGIATDPLHDPRHIYETALFGTCGGRNIVQVIADAYSSPTDKRLHPSCKPEPMLHHFFQMLVDEQTLLLDPTCGSGSSLRAAERLKAKFVLGLESDWDYCEAARKALRGARLLRQQERALA